MCTIKFLIRQPWLYIAAGLLLLGMMVFSVIDANSSKHVVPFDELEPYAGKVMAVQSMSQGRENQRYTLTVALNDGSQKQWQVVSNEAIFAGGEVLAYVHKDKVYDLVVNDQRLIEYQNVIAQDVARAQSAKATLTHPVTILFMLFLFAAGIAIEVFKRRYPERYQKYCVCAMDRLRMMEQEAAQSL